MFTRLRTLQQHDLCGRMAWGLVGVLYTYIVMDIKTNKMKQIWINEMVKMKKQWIDEVNIRSDLLNWMVDEGIYMDAAEFFPKYQEQAKFINLVTEDTTPS